MTNRKSIKRTNNDLQNNSQKTKDCVTRTTLKTRGEFRNKQRTSYTFGLFALDLMCMITKLWHQVKCIFKLYTAKKETHKGILGILIHVQKTVELR